MWMFDRVYNEETAGALDFDQLEDTLSILLELEGVDHTKSKHKAREICKVAKKTSPPSARVAAMSDMQQKTFKNRTTLKHPHKSFKLLLSTLKFFETFMKDH